MAFRAASRSPGDCTRAMRVDWDIIYCHDVGWKDDAEWTLTGSMGSSDARRLLCLDESRESSQSAKGRGEGDGLAVGEEPGVADAVSLG